MIPVLLESRAKGVSGIVACRGALTLQAHGLKKGDEVRIIFFNEIDGPGVERTLLEDGLVELDGHRFVQAEHVQAGDGCVTVELV